MPSFKIFLNNEEEIRRFTIDSVPTWDQFVQKLQQVFHDAFHPELRVQYDDQEGDRITITTEIEWKEAMNYMGSSPVIKLFIKEPPNPIYFKDGPPPSLQYFYDLNGNNPQRQKMMDIEARYPGLGNFVPKCLENLFHGGKILPYNLPTWLRDSGAITIINLPNLEVDLDINVNRLFEVLLSHGTRCLDQKETLEEGKSILQDAMALSPRHPTVHYNLSCAEALLGNPQKAIEELKISIECGYKNLEHIQQDHDLDSLRNLPEFQNVVDSLKPSKQEISVPFQQIPQKQMEIDPPVSVPTSSIVSPLPIASPNPIASPVSIVSHIPNSSPIPIASSLPAPPVAEPAQPPKLKVNPPQESPKSSKLVTRYPEQMKELNNMGFNERQLNEDLLINFNGDIFEVVKKLLEMN